LGIYFGSSYRSGIEKDERERMNQALLLDIERWDRRKGSCKRDSKEAEIE